MMHVEESSHRSQASPHTPLALENNQVTTCGTILACEQLPWVAELAVHLITGLRSFRSVEYTWSLEVVPLGSVVRWSSLCEGVGVAHAACPSYACCIEVTGGSETELLYTSSSCKSGLPGRDATPAAAAKRGTPSVASRLLHPSIWNEPEGPSLNKSDYRPDPSAICETSMPQLRTCALQPLRSCPGHCLQLRAQRL